MHTHLSSIPESWLPVEAAFFSRPAPIVAKELLGCLLLRKYESQWIGGIISETEAYTNDDPASHSFRGPTPRTKSMFGNPGTIYVYRSYGIHFCLNFSTGALGLGEAVLIRALVPTFGIDRLQVGSNPDPMKLCSGPGRLCKALHIDGSFDGELVGEGSLSVWQIPNQEKIDVEQGPRVGITKAMDREWRYGWRDHQSLSKPFVKSKANGRRRQPLAPR
jgi:DNA-3-methyladenine glycosylase